MERILFKPDTHTYTRESDSIELMSVSHFRKLFEKVDWTHNVQKAALQEYLGPTRYKIKKEAWEAEGGHILDPAFITYMVKGLNKKTFEKLCKTIQERWKQKGMDSAEEGTKRHAAKEDKAILDGYSINPVNGLEYPTQPHGKKEDGSNCTIVERLCDLEPGFYSELIVWYFFPEPIFSQSLKKDICGIAGTMDKGYVEPDKIMIGDYKFTGEPLSDFGVNYKNFGKQYHEDPWSDWHISKLSGYRIQLNTYGWMAEQHGLPPADLRIHNTVLKNEQDQEFVIPYEGFRVESAVSKVFIESL